MSETHLKWYNTTLHQYITKDELKEIMQKSNWKAALEVANTWGWIAFAFALAGMYPNPLTIIIALFILGGKQLGCAIIMHDCSHDSMFTTRSLNNFFGNWFGAFPILHDLHKYRPYHVQHHMYTGLVEDPDVSLTKGYPTTAISMTRKFLRDLLGATGIKGVLGVLAMHMGILKYNLGGLVIRLSQKGRKLTEFIATSAKSLAGPVAANLILLGILWLTGHPWLYLLWVGAILTTYNFSLRVRSMAEHSMVDDLENPHKNTRTTYANFFERILFAPHHVNYHAEHHLCMGAPSYNLPKMHDILLERGFYKEGTLEFNYWDVVKRAVTSSPKAH